MDNSRTIFTTKLTVSEVESLDALITHIIDIIVKHIPNNNKSDFLNVSNLLTYKSLFVISGKRFDTNKIPHIEHIHIINTIIIPARGLFLSVKKPPGYVVIKIVTITKNAKNKKVP